MTPFHQASYQAQVLRLRRLAETAIRRYPIQASALHFINHGENTTFRVEARGGRQYLLRIHREGYHTPEAITEELSWLARLGKAKGLRVPVPVRSQSGRLLERVATARLPEGRHCALFEWVHGRFASPKTVTASRMHEIGALIALIQKHGRGRGSHGRRYWNAEGLVGPSPKFGSIDSIAGIRAPQQRKITAYRRQILRKLKTFERRFPSRLGLIHADLHFGNFLVCEGGLGAIDFDDCGHGFHAYDLAIPLTHVRSFLRENPRLDIQALSESLQAGYASVLPWDEHDRAILPVMLAARSLCMLGWLNSRSDNPRLRAHIKGATKRVLKQIRNERR